MRNLDEQEKRDLLKEILMDLSKSQDVLKEPKDRAVFFVRLEDIYYKCDKENFRHFYSDIFAVLTLIDGDSEIGSLDILAQNMEAIKDGYIPKNMDENKKLIDISKEIIKLYDHTNLEIARINYTKTMAHETLSELAKTKKMVADLESDVELSQRNIKKMTDDIIKENNETKEMQKEMQKEYISILGIFASIVLAFTGGMAFSSSVLENIHKASAYRIVLLAFIIGIVFYNLIWVLLDFIRGINGKVIRKTFLWWGVNMILVSGVIFTCIAYRFDWFAREEQITSLKNQQTEQEISNSSTEQTE